SRRGGSMSGMRVARGDASAARAEAKDDLLRRAAQTGTQGASGLSTDQALEFLRLYYRHVALEDLQDRDPSDIGGPALAHRALGEDRPQGRAKVRAFTPTLEEYGWDPGHTVVQVVTDDMPYLIDSLTMELTRQELTTHLIVHPQIGVDRAVTGHL